MQEITDVFLKIQNYLQSSHISYELLKHAPVASAQQYQDELHTRFEVQAKALFVRYTRGNSQKQEGALDPEKQEKQGKGYFVIAIQAQKKADFISLAVHAGVDFIRMAYENELIKVTGCHFGELPPIGNIFGVKLLMDKDFLQEDKIYFNAGRHDFSVSMAPKDLVHLEKPILF